MRARIQECTRIAPMLTTTTYLTIVTSNGLRYYTKSDNEYRQNQLRSRVSSKTNMRRIISMMTSENTFCFQLLEVSDRKTAPMTSAFLCFLFHLIASRFYKIRSSMVPPNPKSPDFEVSELYSRIHDCEDFLIYKGVD